MCVRCPIFPVAPGMAWVTGLCTMHANTHAAHTAPLRRLCAYSQIARCWRAT